MAAYLLRILDHFLNSIYLFMETYPLFSYNTLKKAKIYDSKCCIKPNETRIVKIHMIAGKINSKLKKKNKTLNFVTSHSGSAYTTPQQINQLL